MLEYCYICLAGSGDLSADILPQLWQSTEKQLLFCFQTGKVRTMICYFSKGNEEGHEPQRTTAETGISGNLESVLWFLDLNMEEYMKIQNRLMEEQISLCSSSTIGSLILKGKTPANDRRIRGMVPLTDYEDYADILLRKTGESLPGNPVIWIQTTWEGGKHPIKVAPYTRSMLDTFQE